MASNYFETDTQETTLQTVGVKACLFNLIVISYDLERAVYSQELVHIITERFPCKVLFVRAEQDTQYDFVRTTKRTQSIGSDSNKIFCDVISIEASMNQLIQVPFLILPNITPDLPTYLLLAQDPTQDSLLQKEIAPLVSRIIFSIPTVDNLKRFSAAVRKLIKSDRRQFIDLNWARSKAWREVIAKVFGDKEKLHALETAENINILYTAPPGAQSTQYELQALYMQAWIASRLGWTLTDVTGPRATQKISYSHNGRPITVSICMHDTEVLERGAIWSLEVTGAQDTHFLITHERDSKHVKVHASNSDRCEMPYTIFMSNYQRGGALISELFYQPPSEHYFLMLSIFDSDIWDRHASS